MTNTTTVVLVDWDWADSNPDDPCVRDPNGRSAEASVKVGTVALGGALDTDAAFWGVVDTAEWSDVSYRLAEGVREMVAGMADEGDGFLLVVIRDEGIAGGFLR
jgi:hypothetical protein